MIAIVLSYSTYFNLQLAHPSVMETFDFSPKVLFEEIPLDKFLTYLIYTLEYRALVMEQVSHEREQQYLAAHPDPRDREEGYGVTVMDFTIRDLKGVHTKSFESAAVLVCFFLSQLNCTALH